jgi:hypothetical protein
MNLRIPLAVAVAAALCTLPAPAHAADGQESIFEDHYLLVQQGAQVRARALDDMLTLGADTIRSLVYWRDVAPNSGKKKRPRNFDGANPAAYPAANWDAYDDLVRGTAARGMSLLLSPGAPLPAWGSTCGKVSVRTRRSCRPNVRQYGDFVRALATRYSGAYSDENQGGGVLPRVTRWSLWNEPNQPGWLYPQYEVKSGRRVVTAARLYRALAGEAIDALRATGHGADEILLGELAPIGRTGGNLAKRPSPPAEFLRDLFCIDTRGRKLRGSASRARGCGGYSRLGVTGFAHHPYTRGGSQPPRSRSLPNEITIASVSRLKKLLGQGSRAGRIPRGLPIFYTEFGYQTNPPDRLFGVTLEKQSQYLNESDWIAFQDRRIKSVAQYKLVDEPNVANFQTGLRFTGGQNKPAWDAYRLPLWVKRSGANVKVYGQIRPADDGSLETVLIQSSPKEGDPFTTVQAVAVSSPKGHFLVDVPKRAGLWRLAWTPSGGGRTAFSREARSSKR